jgi:hypothetical protein
MAIHFTRQASFTTFSGVNILKSADLKTLLILATRKRKITEKVGRKNYVLTVSNLIQEIK